MFRIEEIDGKKQLVRIDVIERYFYDVEIRFIKDDFSKPLVTDYYEVEVEANKITDLPFDDEAMPMLAAMFHETNPEGLSDEELDTVQFTMIAGPLMYQEFSKTVIGEV